MAAASCVPRATPSRCGCTTSLIPELGKAVPYGVYDIAANAGWVSVGIDHDTAAFAVESIRRWWHELGRSPLSTGDASADHRRLRRQQRRRGSGCGNANCRSWPTRPGLTITVCHLPPGTSKWNQIEHRLFSFITQNWRGKPLVSHQVIVQLIGATTTKTGLSVACRIDDSLYPKGVAVSDDEINAINLTCDEFHGEWNYTICTLTRLRISSEPGTR